MRLTVTVLSALVVCPLACASSARRPNPESAAPSAAVDAVIDEYYHAIGGYERLESIKTRRMSGTYVEGSLHATTDILWERPSLRRVNVHAPGFEYSEGFDG